MHCAKCNYSVNPIHELQDNGRVLPVCPECSGLLTPTLAQVVATEAVKPLSVVEHDIVILARARLVAIEAQLLTYDKLRNEADTLRRMLAAVED